MRIAGLLLAAALVLSGTAYGQEISAARAEISRTLPVASRNPG